MTANRTANRRRPEIKLVVISKSAGQRMVTVPRKKINNPKSINGTEKTPNPNHVHYDDVITIVAKDPKDLLPLGLQEGRTPEGIVVVTDTKPFERHF